MIFINASIGRSRQDDGTIVALSLARTDAHYIEVAAACKRGGAEFPGIPQLKQR
jgi:hypothetical protein